MSMLSACSSFARRQAGPYLCDLLAGCARRLRPLAAIAAAELSCSVLQTLAVARPPQHCGATARPTAAQGARNCVDSARVQRSRDAQLQRAIDWVSAHGKGLLEGRQHALRPGIQDGCRRRVRNPRD